MHQTVGDDQRIMPLTAIRQDVRRATTGPVGPQNAQVTPYGRHHRLVSASLQARGVFLPAGEQSRHALGGTRLNL